MQHDLNAGHLALQLIGVSVQSLWTEVDAIQVGLENIRILVAEINRLRSIPFEPLGFARSTQELGSLGEDVGVDCEALRRSLADNDVECSSQGVPVGCQCDALIRVKEEERIYFMRFAGRDFSAIVALLIVMAMLCPGAEEMWCLERGRRML